MVIVLAEHQKGQVKKSALEAVTFGAQTAHAMGVSCAALVIGQVADAAQLGKYGASKVYVVEHPSLSVFDPQVYTAVIAAAFQQLGAKVLVLSHSANGRALLGRLAARLDAGSVSGVNAVPVFNTHLEVSKPVFSGKAVATYAIKTSTAVLSLTGNAVQPQVVGTEVPVEVLDLPVPAGKITVKSVNRQEGRVSLPEAELVVSAGRGMKGPENWGIIEDLADSLGATTACSRPVADAGWRPHHEHVGQTGLAIRPNLYIAVGISGAIQHLAGVNNSKTIVVINKDAEAPFFKAADYGVVGDLFEVVPRLTEAIRKYQATHH